VKHRVAVYCLLLLAVLAVYAPVQHFDFVNYDDPDYVVENAHVRAGVTAETVAWAFTSREAANWIPLTWLSHMAVVQFFGLESGWHHLANVLLHAMSTLLLFAVLRRMTGATWRSALVAFLFALHPLRVESVAWISERKDVLSGFFFMLTLWCYARYVERPGTRRYVLTAIAFSLGLLAKPMLVTLPFVLLLLDVWPLGRVKHRAALRALIIEKVPLLLLAIAASVVTFLVQRSGGAVLSLDDVSLPARVGNALVSYCVYIAQMLWPARLAVFYPFVQRPAWQQIAAAAAVLGASVVVLRARRHPYLATGWFWYLGTLLPVIGLVQAGEQSHADRYTYLPLIGIFFMLVWAAAEAAARWRAARLAIAAAAAICIACTAATYTQLQYWKSSEALMAHAIEVTSGNYVAHDNYGVALRRRGRIDEALVHFREALLMHPRSLEAHNNIGEALLAQGHPAEAMPYFLRALQLKPDYAEAHVNLGSALGRLGRSEEALPHFRQAIALRANYAEAHAGLGYALAAAGRRDEGLRELFAALRMKPDYADGQYGLGVELAQAGRTAEAIEHFTEAIRLQPNDAAAHFNLGTALGAQERIEEAAGEFRTALRLRPAYANAELNLGKALAYLGRNDEAVAHLREAVRLDPTLTDARDALAELTR
jgi:protein O-mannosyl-transferase